MVGSRQWIDGGRRPGNGPTRRALTPECGRFTTEDTDGTKEPKNKNRTPEGVNYRSELRKLVAEGEHTTWAGTRTSKTSLLGGPLQLLDCGGSGVPSIISVPFGGPTHRL